MQSGSTRRHATRLLVASAVVVATPLALALSPPAVLFVAAVDAASSERDFRRTRLVLMVLHVLILEWLGMMAALALWVATGFGWFMASPRSRRAHYAVQRWWAGAVFAAAQRWLGLVVEFEDGDVLADGPVIIAANHASFLDALLPSIVLSRHSEAMARHVLKRELAWDPCLGIFGHRHPNHFVTRGGAGRDTELAAIEALATDAGDDALVIFPEGTFPSAVDTERVRERLAQREPARAARLRLRHLLPPRPGGLQALRRGNPHADLAFLAHTGFESFGSLRSIVANVPFRSPVKAKLWRVPAAQLPTDPEQLLATVDGWWQRMDDWIADATDATGARTTEVIAATT